MTPEEQRALAIECGFEPPLGWTINTLICNEIQLAAYTAAVEAKERERTSLIVKNILDTSPIEHMRMPDGEYIAVYRRIFSY